MRLWEVILAPISRQQKHSFFWLVSLCKPAEGQRLSFYVLMPEYTQPYLIKKGASYISAQKKSHFGGGVHISDSFTQKSSQSTECTDQSYATLLLVNHM